MAITTGDVMKRCTICGDTKPYSEFHRQSSSKDGHCGWCKPCKSIKKAEQYSADSDRIKKRASDYRKENPAKASEAKKASYRKNIEHYKSRGKKYYADNREAILAYYREQRAANPEKKAESDRQYRDANREKINIRQAAYQRENWERIKGYQREYWKRRAKQDPMCALKFLVRRRVLFAFSNHGYPKDSNTSEMLGCDYATLKHHLESQFTPGMTWANRGEWHVDHRIPLASARNESELIGLCHYTNLQPLWAKDNLSKGAKMPDEMNLERRQCSPLYSPSPAQSRQSLP